MAAADPRLLLYLKFGSLQGTQLLDASGNGNHARVTNGRVLADARFGSCLSLEDPAAFIDLVPAAIPTGGAFTVGVWVRDLKAPPGAWLLDARTAAGDPVIGVQLPTPDTPGTDWTHWAVSHAAAGAPVIYRNGVALTGADLPAASVLAAAVVAKPATASTARFGAPAGTTPGPHFAAKVAALRVYDQALDAAAVAGLMADDQTALSSFRQSFPIDFAVRTDADDQPVLYITDDPAGVPMHLELTNASGQDLHFGAATDYHLALRFRPGTLAADPSGTRLAALRAALPGWDASFHPNANGSVDLYLLAKSAVTLPAAAPTLKLPLAGLCADGTGGARRTRVKLRYQAVTLGTQVVPLAGARATHLSVLNRVGQAHIPLHAGFVGPGEILNDGRTLNQLFLRVTNTDPQASLAFTTASRLVLSFDVQGDGRQADWAAGTLSQVRAMTPTVTEPGGWTATQSVEGETPVWALAPAAAVALAPGAAVAVTLAGLVSSLPAGQANVYVRYENVPGYWDGQLVAQLTKSPVVVSPDNRVAVNGNTLTVDPRGFATVGTPAQGVINGAQGVGVTLTVHATDGHLQLRREVTDPAGVHAPKYVFLELFQNDNPGTTTPVYPSIRFHHGTVFWHRIEARPEGLYIKDGDSNSDTFRDIYAGAGNFEQLRVAAGTTPGGVTVGTAAPGVVYSKGTPDFGARVTIHATDGHLQLRREKTDPASGNAPRYTFLELFQDANPNDKPVYPSIRFHQHDVFWHRLEARPEGFFFRSGDPTSDAPSDVFAGNGRFVKQIDCQNVAATNGTFQEIQARQLNGVSKWFRIPHPARPGHDLVHACLEGPESGVYYRGRARLRGGRAEVRLPEYFEALTRPDGRTVTLTAVGREPYLLSYEDVVGGGFRVYGTKPDGEFSWEVKAVRADVDALTVEVPTAAGDAR